MPISRRGFLNGILVAASAPAFVKASSLMPIYVPKQDIIVPSVGRGMTTAFVHIDESAFVYDCDVSSMYAFSRLGPTTLGHKPFFHYDPMLAIAAEQDREKRSLPRYRGRT